MKLFELLLILVTIELISGNPAPDFEEATTIEIEIMLTENKSLSAEETVKKKPPKEMQQLPLDLEIQDVLLDPSVILSRLTRSAGFPESIRGNEPLDFNFGKDGIPNFPFARFVRTPRNNEQRENEEYKDPREGKGLLHRSTRSLNEDGIRGEDLDAADDGFIIRPLFKYRHEQNKRSNTRRFRNKESYSYYPRYPIFPGK